MLKNFKNYLKNNLPNFFLILKKTKQLYIILLSYEYLKKPIIFLKKAIKNLFFYFFKPILVIIYEKIIDKRSKYFNDYFYKKNHNFTKIPKVKKKRNILFTINSHSILLQKFTNKEIFNIRPDAVANSFE